jgi:arylformamidase
MPDKMIDNMRSPEAVMKGRMIDLSHVMIPDHEEYHLRLKTHQTKELYPQYPVDKDTWYILQDIEMSSHCGTHIEFPYHHNRNGMDAANFPLTRLIGECVLLDFHHKKSGEAVTLAELIARENKIKEGDMILFYFDCAKYYRTQDSHERPYIEYDAAEWLVNVKKVNLVGSDASGIEIKNAPNQPIHQLLMDREIPIIEFAANLDQLNSERFTLLALALPVQGLDSCPVRLTAIEDI